MTLIIICLLGLLLDYLFPIDLECIRAEPISTTIALVTAILGALGGGRSREESTSQSETLEELLRSFSESGEFENQPIIPEDTLGLRQFLLGESQNLEGPLFNEDFLDTIRQQRLEQINTDSGNLRSRLANTLRNRGLGNSNLSSLSDVIAEQVRASEIGGVESEIAQQKFQLPLLQEQARTDRLGLANQILQGIPIGERGTSSRAGESESRGFRQGTQVTTGERGGILGALGGAQSGFDIGSDIAQTIGFNSGARN